MAFPQRLLGEDEEVVLHLHPHVKVLVGPAVLVPVVAGLAGFGAAVLPSGRYQRYGQYAILAVAVLLLLRFSVLPWARWLATHVVLTTHRVILRSGVLARRGRDIPLGRVTDVTFTHSLVERFLGCGTLVVESAGERGQIVLTDVPHVETAQRELYRLIEADDRRRRSPVADE